MVPPAPNAPDRIAVIAAKLAELGKRPISPSTHAELTRLHEELDSLVNDFVMCDRCGNLFPEVAQLTIGGRTANVCASCGITSLQKWAIVLSGDERASSGGRRTRKRASSPASRQGGSKGTRNKSDASVLAEAKPKAAASSPRKRAAASQQRAAGEAEEKEDPAPQTPAAPPINDEPTSAPSEEKREEGDVRANGEPAADDAATPAPTPRRVARRARNDESPFKATVPQAAKFLKRPARDIRQISKLITEISPPMDTEKTTRYVTAELRNTRSKIPMDAVAQIVATLKEGIPGAENGDGGA